MESAVDPMLQLYFADEAPLTFSNDLIELTKTLEGISEMKMPKVIFAFLVEVYKNAT